MHINDNVSDIMKEVEKELSAVAKEILEPELDEDSKQGAVMVAGYIVKKKKLAHILSTPNTNITLWILKVG